MTLSKTIFFTSADKNGCGWYRTKMFADFLKQEHHWLFPAYKEADGSLTMREPRIFSSDIILIQRQTHPFFVQAIPYLQSLGKKVVFDLDDNLWRIPSTNPAQKFYHRKELKNLEAVIKLCDYVITSTEPLKEFFLVNRLHQNIEVIPNMLNDMQYAKIVDNHKVRIGYCGSPSHKGDFDHYICKALRKLKEKYGVQLIMFGYNPISGAEDLYFPGCEVHEYLDTINNLDLDIGIAPLADDEFNRAKSNLKFLEYTYCSIPTVASSVYPYKHTITHNENGILIENSKQWYDELEKLVLDKRKRIELIVNARKFVSDNFTFKNNGDLIISKWEKIISEMYK